jgi:CDP-diacylglycerol---serine O-phosphatidyltransferase
VVTVLLGLFMVSNFRYRSFKDLEWRHHVSFLMVLLVVLLFVIVSLSPPLVLLIGFVSYALSGPIITYRTTRKITMEHVVGDADERFYEGEIDEGAAETSEEA